jgi:hypothetical protein
MGKATVQHVTAVLFALLATVASGDTWQLEDVRTAAKYQASLLRNFEAEYITDFTFIDPQFLGVIDEDEPKIGLTRHRYIWEGSKWRSEQRVFTPQGQIMMETMETVDESTHMTLAYRADDEGHLATLGVGRVFARDIGLDTGGVIPDRFMLANNDGESFVSLLDSGRATLMPPGQVDGQEAVVVETRGTRYGTRIRLYLDPHRGFSVVRKEIYTVPGDDLFLVFENITLAKVGDDLWLPVAGDVTLYNRDKNGRQYKAQVIRMTLSEEKLKINRDLNENTFRIRFPDGSDVMDEIADIHYVTGVQKVMDGVVDDVKENLARGKMGASISEPNTADAMGGDANSEAGGNSDKRGNATVAGPASQAEALSDRDKHRNSLAYRTGAVALVFLTVAGLGFLRRTAVRHRSQ